MLPFSESALPDVGPAAADRSPRAGNRTAPIPAMPGYADLAAHAWLRAAARARGMTPRQANDLVALAGSHMGGPAGALPPRAPPPTPFPRALREPARYALANPVNGMLEAKALFARLSECGEDEGLASRAGLDGMERAAAQRLPVTRRVRPQ